MRRGTWIGVIVTMLQRRDAHGIQDLTGTHALTVCSSRFPVSLSPDSSFSEDLVTLSIQV